MRSIKCPHCGLTNWATEELCKRCGAALLALGSQDSKPETPTGLPWKKLLLILFLVGVVATPLLLWRRQTSQHQDMSAAIKSSSLFADPLTLEASKTNAAYEKLSPEAVTLVKAGLLVYERDSPYQMTEEGPSGLPPRLQYKPTPSRFYPKDASVAQDWRTLEDPSNGKSGFVIPVGWREWVELTSVEWADASNAKVSFRWKWKPNDLGKHFDAAQMQDPHGTPKSHPRLKSRFPYGGNAELMWTDNKWLVKSIKWNMDDTSLLSIVGGR